MNIEETMVSGNRTRYDSADIYALLMSFLADESFSYGLTFYPHLSYLPVRIETWYGDKKEGLHHVGTEPVAHRGLWRDLIKRPAVVEIGRYKINIATPAEIGAAMSPIESLMLQAGDGYLPDWAACQVLFQSIFVAGGRVGSPSTLYAELYLWLTNPKNSQAKIRVHPNVKSKWKGAKKSDVVVGLTESLAVKTSPSSKAWVAAKAAQKASHAFARSSYSRAVVIAKLSGQDSETRATVSDKWADEVAAKSKKELLSTGKEEK